MLPRLALAAALIGVPALIRAAPPEALPLASHRAAYDISLIEPSSPPASAARTPIAASGLIAYEFRGSPCEGYTSNFRQMTEMERSEGDPLSMQVNASSFEDADGKSMRFRVDASGAQETPPVAGKATRNADDDLLVELTKPAARTIDFGHDVLFPTQHIERLIGAAKNGGGTVQARVYDGSDTGAKIFSTLAVIGKEAMKPNDDTETATDLRNVRRWPVVVSYFNEASTDAPPEYTLSFDLCENGVSGSLKLDYGAFALRAKLRKLEMLPTSGCSK
ncbi:MAG: cell envelope integrity EipB family protein [Hyphomicrobiales bacterium]|nr:cell envelope integrity EipB family protein [Hyphomicrobiales bacterium]